MSALGRPCGEPGESARETQKNRTNDRGEERIRAAEAKQKKNEKRKQQQKTPETNEIKKSSRPSLFHEYSGALAQGRFCSPESSEDHERAAYILSQDHIMCKNSER